MARIYFGLAIFSFALLALNIVLGLATGDYGDAAAVIIGHSPRIEQEQRSDQPDPQLLARLIAERDAARAAHASLRSALTLHMLLGIAAALVAVLVNSISVTYFVGTSRWCREVVDTYRLDLALAEQSQRLKRRTFPWALAGMLTIILLVALGALADPSVFADTANPTRHLTWRTAHFFAAILGTIFIGYSFYVQTQNVAANYRVIEQILAEVRRIRQERGLDNPLPSS